MLEYLVNITEDHTVEVAFGTHGEEVCPTVGFHFEDGVFDFDEFSTDKVVVCWEVRKSSDYICGFVLVACEDEPLVRC